MTILHPAYMGYSAFKGKKKHTILDKRPRDMPTVKIRAIYTNAIG